MSLIFAPQIYLINQRSPSPFTWWQAIISNFTIFYLWALLTPLVIWVGKRLPLERTRVGRNLAILVLLGFPFALLHIILLYPLSFIFLSWTKGLQNPVPLRNLVIGSGATNVLIYWAILVASQAMFYFERYRSREESLAKAQLQALKTQLHPHFLFNTLNALSELVYDDPVKADKSIAKLSDLLRLSLRSKQTQEVPLEEELEFLRTYLEIQQTLLQKRLQIEWEIETEILNARVPNMILQPLAENSIQHGIVPRISGGTLRITGKREKDWLVLQIQDDGLGLNSDAEAKLESDDDGEGIGLYNTRMRLKHLYGRQQEFSIENLPENRGVLATLKIPFVEREIYELEN